MLGHFNIPCVDHLREGIDYRVVDWDFADSAPAPAASHIPGTPCEEGEKMVFGVCRKLKEGTPSDDKDFDSSKKTKQETALEESAKAAGKLPTTKEEAVAANAKGFSAGGKKYGWAMKNNKPVLVEWGSVAGVKKVGPKQPQQAASTSGGAAGGGGGSAASAAPRATAAAPARSTGVGNPLSTADRAAYAAGGGNAAAQRGAGSSTEQVIAQGRRNLERMDQGRGRS